MFNNYRIPRENLLNKTGDVTADGQYESVFSEPTKILGAALESFSAGRIGIMQESSNTLADAIVIAVRYAAVRKQFGQDIDGPEMPIIEYQLHVSYDLLSSISMCVMESPMNIPKIIPIRIISTNGFNICSNGVYSHIWQLLVY